MKRPVKILLAFLPAILLLGAGVGSALYSRASIDNAATAQGKIDRVFKRVHKDSNGRSEVSCVAVSFPTADGKTSTLEADVFSTLFLSAGDAVTVRYDARDPTKAKLNAGLFGEPFQVVFLILFGAFWLALPTILLVAALTGKANKQELIERLRSNATSASAR
jgi:hypothetical protein